MTSVVEPMNARFSHAKGRFAPIGGNPLAIWRCTSVCLSQQ
jgi:hypothetical protein